MNETTNINNEYLDSTQMDDCRIEADQNNDLAIGEDAFIKKGN